jgi:hypothetical protein
MRVPTFLLATILLAFSFLSGCGGEKEAEQDTAQPFDSTKPIVAKAIPSPEEQLVKSAAEKLVEQFTVNLRSELTLAMGSGDAAGAIEVCSRKAPQLATDISVGGWSIRRVSMFNRNANNYPSTEESVMLQRFANDTTKKSSAVWLNRNGLRLYKYFQPIYMQQMCTTCHGKTEQMDPTVVERLQQLYPNDRAVGMSAGDLRGMFVVTAEWPAGEDQAKKIVSRSSN